MTPPPPPPPTVRSATEYVFRDDQIEAILRTTTYPIDDHSRAVIWFLSHEHDDVRQSLSTPFNRASVLGSSPFDRLTLELLQDVLLRLDMHSLFKLRQTNLRARQTVDSLKQYQLIASHGLNLFCAVFRTGIARSISLSDFYSALCTKVCTSCGKFGGFMFLPTWERCCYKCLTPYKKFGVQSLAAVRFENPLTPTQAAQLTSLKTLPGKYSTLQASFKARFRVVSCEQASVVAGKPYYRLRVGYRPFPNRQARVFHYMASCALPHYDIRTGKIEHGLLCSGCRLAVEKGLVSSSSSDWMYDTHTVAYAENEFLKHFRWCAQAQLLWDNSEGGTRQSPELLEIPLAHD